jgi:uncharacterized protein (TIGR02001 family)
MWNLSAKALVLTAALSLLTAMSTKAEVSVDADLTVGSHYIWRGNDFLNGAKMPLMPSVTVGHESGLSANVWGSFAALDRDKTDGADEIDFTIDYSTDISSDLGVSVGVIYYAYPNAGDDNTSELYLGASYAAPGSPSLTVYYDNEFVDGSNEGSGLYISLAGGHAVPVGNLSIDLGASLGFGAKNDVHALQDLNLSASTSMPVGSLNVSPFVVGTYIIEDTVNPKDSFEIYGGVSIGLGF